MVYGLTHLKCDHQFVELLSVQAPVWLLDQALLQFVCKAWL